MILWKGHCSVHGRFSAECVDECARAMPGVQVLVHPECTARGGHQGRPGRLDGVHHQDRRGRAAGLDAGRSAPSSTSCSGSRTPHPEQHIAFLDKTVCYCSTMNRIDLPHFVWAMENLVAGHVVNRIEVDPETERWAKVALQRMLDLPGRPADWRPRLKATGGRPPRRSPAGHRPGAPQRASSGQVLLHGQLASSQVADLDLQQVVAPLRAGRGERVEGALLVEVDQAEPAPGRVGERRPASRAGRGRSPAPRARC